MRCVLSRNYRQPFVKAISRQSYGKSISPGPPCAGIDTLAGIYTHRQQFVPRDHYFLAESPRRFVALHKEKERKGWRRSRKNADRSRYIARRAADFIVTTCRHRVNGKELPLHSSHPCYSLSFSLPNVSLDYRIDYRRRILPVSSV